MFPAVAAIVGFFPRILPVALIVLFIGLWLGFRDPAAAGGSGSGREYVVYLALLVSLLAVAEA